MKLLRFIRTSFSSAIVLIYHRICDLRFDPQLLCVSPEKFAEHLDILKTHFHPISLQKMHRGFQEGNLPNKSVCITFDDGYSDNYSTAKPILEKFGVPATFFVISGWVDSNQELWWDDLERLILLSPELPERITVCIRGKNYEWETGRDRYLSEQIIEENQDWTVLWNHDRLTRHKLYRTLHSLLRPLSAAERSETIQSLVRQSKSETTGRQSHRTMTSSELRSFAQSELFEIGAHTATHPQLVAMPSEIQQKEIGQSKKELEGLIGSEITSFAYPYGTLLDYDRKTVSLVRDSGFSRGCSNFAGRFKKSTDPFQIPRIPAKNYRGTEFLDYMRSSFAS